VVEDYTVAGVEEHDDLLLPVLVEKLHEIENLLESRLALDVTVLERLWNFVLVISLFLHKLGEAGC
jgi:hypothetical protein